MWVSTRYGLNLYNPMDNNFHRFRFGTGGELDITKITGSADGGLWICNYPGGVYHFDTSEKSFRQIIPNEQSQEPAMTALDDNQGFLWVDTGGQGVHVYLLKNLTAQPEIVLNEKLNKLNLRYVEAIFGDTTGNIWIGSREGLVLYQRKSDEFFRFNKTTDPLSLGGNIILDITQDKNGNLLIGTQEGGLSILSREQLQKNKPQAFEFQKIVQGSEDQTLSYRSVQSVFEDRDRISGWAHMATEYLLISWTKYLMDSTRSVVRVYPGEQELVLP